MDRIAGAMAENTMEIKRIEWVREVRRYDFKYAEALH